MNLLSLYYFVELARELHMTNAAQKLYISQQNLSQHIHRLEQHYGVTLFYRKPKLSLTYAGEQLYRTAVKILAEESDLVNQLSSISTEKKGSLKVGIPAYRGQICLPQILPLFYNQWPNVSIQLFHDPSEKMESMLCDGELDLFIGIMYQDDPRLNVTPILNDMIYLVCSDRLLSQSFGDAGQDLKQRAVCGADLKSFGKLPFLLPKPPMKLRKIIDSCFQDARVTPNIFLESSTTELLISLFPHDYGAIFCTQMRLPILFAAAPDANAFPLLCRDSVIQHRLVIASHRERLLPPYAQDFVKITQNVFYDISRFRTGGRGV